jgi:hypothetical protein
MKNINHAIRARRYRLALIMFGLLLALGWTAYAVRAAGKVTYLPQPGTPAAIPNFIQPAQGCAWAAIGGQLFDRSGAPVSGLVLKLSGTYQGQNILKYAVSNSSQSFGPGGYDFYLGNQALATNTLTLQVLDVGGAARSAPIRINTFASCQQNLLVLNLIETALENLMYLPMIRK